MPCALTLYARLRIREAKPFEKFLAKETSLTAKDKCGLRDQFRDFREYFSQWKHTRTLIAVSITWFLFDIAFHGVNLNQSIILSRTGFAGGSTPWQKFHNTAIGNVIQVSAGYMPGYWLGIFLPDIVGRVRQQFLGSAIVALLYAICAGVGDNTSTTGLTVLFTLSQFVLNAGPASFTFSSKCAFQFVTFRCNNLDTNKGTKSPLRYSQLEFEARDTVSPPPQERPERFSRRLSSVQQQMQWDLEACSVFLLGPLLSVHCQRSGSLRLESFPWTRLNRMLCMTRRWRR